MAEDEEVPVERKPIKSTRFITGPGEPGTLAFGKVKLPPGKKLFNFKTDLDKVPVHPDIIDELIADHRKRGLPEK